jgi:hypothetical protein
MSQCEWLLGLNLPAPAHEIDVHVGASRIFERRVIGVLDFKFHFHSRRYGAAVPFDV